MEIEDQLRTAWNAESGAQADLAGLTARVRRQQRRRVMQRALEVTLTGGAVAVFAHALISQAMEPAHWLLLPFFAVFLPTVWLLTLRRPRTDAEATVAPTQVYARIRMAQLRISLRDLWLARRAAQGLLVYALMGCLGAWIFGDAHWREAALWLLIYALAWLGASLLVTHRIGRRTRSEYRNLRGLLED